jgi:hypothetical protein
MEQRMQKLKNSKIKADISMIYNNNSSKLNNSNIITVNDSIDRIENINNNIKKINPIINDQYLK